MEYLSPFSTYFIFHGIQYGDTPIMLCVHLGDYAVKAIELLLQHGADVNARNLVGQEFCCESF